MDREGPGGARQLGSQPDAEAISRYDPLWGACTWNCHIFRLLKGDLLICSADRSYAARCCSTYLMHASGSLTALILQSAQCNWPQRGAPAEAPGSRKVPGA